MIDATLSRVRMRDLGGLGRFRPAQSGRAGLRRPCASRRRAGTDTPGIDAVTSPCPSAPSSRPGAGDFMASTI